MPSISDGRLQTIALNIERNALLVVFGEAIAQLEVPHLEIQKLLGEILVRSVPRLLALERWWTHPDSQSHSLAASRRSARRCPLSFRAGDNFQSDPNSVRAEKRRRLRCSPCREDERRDLDRQVAPVVIEPSDFDAPARRRFGDRDNPGSHLVLEPIGLNEALPRCQESDQHQAARRPLSPNSQIFFGRLIGAPRRGSELLTWVRVSASQRSMA